MERLGKKDKKVIAAFIDRKPMNGLKLDTDGQRLDGAWMGGMGIAEWVDAPARNASRVSRVIRLNDLGSRSAETVHRVIRREAPRMYLEEYQDMLQKKYDKATRK